MHYILEKTAREVKRRGGFAAVDDKTLRELCEAASLRSTSPRSSTILTRRAAASFYLFNRLCGDVWALIVEDMAAELRRSDFEPLDFELDFSDAREMPPVELGGRGGQPRPLRYRRPCRRLVPRRQALSPRRRL